MHFRCTLKQNSGCAVGVFSLLSESIHPTCTVSAAIVTVMKPWQTFTQAQDAIAQTQQVSSKQSQSQLAQLVLGSIYDGGPL